MSLDRSGTWSRFILGVVLVDAGKLTAEAVDSLEWTKDVHPAARVLLDRILAASDGSGQPASLAPTVRGLPSGSAAPVERRASN
jgi:hypothetical protein